MAEHCCRADVGAGTGKLTGLLLEQGLSVEAVEPITTTAPCVSGRCRRRATVRPTAYPTLTITSAASGDTASSAVSSTSARARSTSAGTHV